MFISIFDFLPSITLTNPLSITATNTNIRLSLAGNINGGTASYGISCTGLGSKLIITGAGKIVGNTTSAIINNTTATLSISCSDVTCSTASSDPGIQSTGTGLLTLNTATVTNNGSANAIYAKKLN